MDRLITNLDNYGHYFGVSSLRRIEPVVLEVQKSNVN